MRFFEPADETFCDRRIFSLTAWYGMSKFSKSWTRTLDSILLVRRRRRCYCSDSRTPSHRNSFPERSAGAFRTVWAFTWNGLDIKKHHLFAPSPLRVGGAAVWGHRQKLGIDELRWKMRLQDSKTLQYTICKKLQRKVSCLACQMIRDK